MLSSVSELKSQERVVIFISVLFITAGKQVDTLPPNRAYWAGTHPGEGANAGFNNRPGWLRFLTLPKKRTHFAKLF